MLIEIKSSIKVAVFNTILSPLLILDLVFNFRHRRHGLKYRTLVYNVNLKTI